MPRGWSKINLRLWCKWRVPYSDTVLFGELATGMSNGKGAKAMFAGWHFDREAILLCVRLGPSL
jgi:hypothetical protein